MNPIPKSTTLTIDRILGLMSKAGKKGLDVKTLVHNILQAMENSRYVLIHVYSHPAVGECYVYVGIIPDQVIVDTINREIEKL